MNITSKGDIIILKENGKIIEVTFSHWQKQHGNSTKFYDVNGKLYDVKNSI